MAEKQMQLGGIIPATKPSVHTEKPMHVAPKETSGENPEKTSAKTETSSPKKNEMSSTVSNQSEKSSTKVKIEKINQGDFIEIEYTGKTAEGNSVFDTTDEKTAKGAGVHNPNMEYGPLIVCIGQSNVLAGLEQALIGKDTGKKYTIPISPELGFGKKSAKLVELIPTTKFLKEKIHPMPGLQVNIDNRMGTVRTVSGGRTLVDFNHPLSGRDLVYDVKVFGKITDPRKKVMSILRMQLNLKDFFVEIKADKATIGFKEKRRLPEPLFVPLKKMITELVPEIKEIDFKEDKSVEKKK